MSVHFLSGPTHLVLSTFLPFPSKLRLFPARIPLHSLHLHSASSASTGKSSTVNTVPQCSQRPKVSIKTSFKVPHPFIGCAKLIKPDKKSKRPCNAPCPNPFPTEEKKNLFFVRKMVSTLVFENLPCPILSNQVKSDFT